MLDPCNQQAAMASKTCENQAFPAIAATADMLDEVGVQFYLNGQLRFTVVTGQPPSTEVVVRECPET